MSGYGRRDGGGGGGGRFDSRDNFRPGDWECDCGTHNFARRDTCFKCEAPRSDDGGGSGGRGRAPRSNNRGGGRGRAPQRMRSRSPPSNRGGGGDWRAGDWECFSCGGNNFAKRTECFKCSEPKSEGGDHGYGGYNRGRGGNAGGYDRRDNGYGRSDRGPERREGDWECPCGTNNFARRTECFKCEEPKK